MQSTKEFNPAVLLLFIVIALISRTIPHIPNFSPLAAIAIFSAAYWPNKWQAYLISIFAAWVSDVVILNTLYAQYYPEFTWFYDGFYWQYTSYLLIAFLSSFALKTKSFTRIIATTLGSSLLFFIITNFGCWIGNNFYPQNFAGLMQSYWMGIPFLKGTVLGDLVYSFLLFGSYEFVRNKYSFKSFSF